MFQAQQWKLFHLFCPIGKLAILTGVLIKDIQILSCRMSLIGVV